MSTALKTRNTDFVQQLTARRETIVKALPVGVEHDRFLQAIQTAVAKNPQLLTADRASLMLACIQAAADGLMPNGREAAFVMFKDSVQYMPMLAGVLKLLRNSGKLDSINAAVVYDCDDFEYEMGGSPRLKHVPNIDRPENAKIRCAYAVARIKGVGEPVFRVMTMSEIDKRRRVSRSNQRGPWVDWFEEMAQKTVIRSLCKMLPSSTDVERVIESMDRDVDLSRPSMSQPLYDESEEAETAEQIVQHVED